MVASACRAVTAKTQRQCANSTISVPKIGAVNTISTKTELVSETTRAISSPEKRSRMIA